MDVEAKLQEQYAYYQQRELKSDATQQQQTKLINYLQTKLEENKKKKTFTDKLFGTSHNKKENIPPSNFLFKPNRDIDSMLVGHKKLENKESFQRNDDRKSCKKISKTNIEIESLPQKQDVVSVSASSTSVNYDASTGVTPMEGFVKISG